MALPPFAALDAFEERLPGLFAGEDEQRRAAALLADASALVRTIVGRDWVDEDLVTLTAPPVVAQIVLAAALRAYTNPEGLTSTSETIVGYSSSSAYSSETVGNSITFTVGETRTLRLAAGLGGVVSVPVQRPELIGDATIYVDAGGGDPLPWFTTTQ